MDDNVGFGEYQTTRANAFVPIHQADSPAAVSFVLDDAARASAEAAVAALQVEKRLGVLASGGMAGGKAGLQGGSQGVRVG